MFVIVTHWVKCYNRRKLGGLRSKKCHAFLDGRMEFVCFRENDNSLQCELYLCESYLYLNLERDSNRKGSALRE